MFKGGFVLIVILIEGPALLGQAGPPAADSGFTLYAASQLVVLNVGVQDAHGQNVKGLEVRDFKVYEDGHLQTIKQFAAEDRPVTIGIVVDASGSMRTKQVEVTTAALAFIRSSNPADEVFVVNFNEHPSLGLPPGLPFSRDPPQLRAALLGRKPEGRTALYDALTMGADHLAKGKWENKALLLISDGGDNNSTHTFKETVRAVQSSGATVYSIGLFDPEDSEHDLGALRRLSKMTGGESFTPMELSEITSLCRRIAGDIRASYTIAYTPPRPEQHSVARKIRIVAASRPAGNKLSVRARTSYILAER